MTMSMVIVTIDNRSPVASRQRTVENMWEEVEAECVRTIECGELDQTIHLSRRHRWKPLAFDVDDRIAVVVVALRGKRAGGSIRTYDFHRRDDVWVCVGFGGGSGGGGQIDDRLLPGRPEPGDRWFVAHGSGSFRVPSVRRRMIGGGYARHAVILTASGVAQTDVRGHRLPVADHGFVCVAWRGRSMPDIQLLDSNGDVLDCVTRRDSSIRSRPPSLVRLYRRVFLHSDRGEWFNYAPRQP